MIIVFLDLILSSSLVTLCLYHACGMKEAALRGEVSVWVVCFIFFVLVFGWAVYFLVEKMVCFLHVQGKPGVAKAVMVYAVSFLVVLFFMTVAFFWWLF